MMHTKTWVAPFNRHWPDLHQTQTLFLIGFVGWNLFIMLQTEVQGNLQQVPQSTVQHLERKVNETAKHSIIFCRNWDIFPKTSL